LTIVKDCIKLPRGEEALLGAELNFGHAAKLATKKYPKDQSRGDNEGYHLNFLFPVQFFIHNSSWSVCFSLISHRCSASSDSAQSGDHLQEVQNLRPGNLLEN
jgi:hypothetical protein